MRVDKGTEPKGVRPSQNGTPGRRTPIAGASIDDLATRLGAIEGVNDDTALFLAHNWRKLVGGAVIVLLVIALSHMYNEAQYSRRGGASRQYGELSALFERVLKPSVETPADGSAPPDANAKAMLLGKVPALENVDRGGVYASLGDLYRVAVELQSGDIEAARESLNRTSPPDFSSLTKAKTTKEVAGVKLEKELGALLKARIEIAGGKVEEGRKQLLGVVRGARVLNLEALIAYARTAPNVADPDVKAVANELLAARPELRSVVEQSLAEEGISLAEGSPVLAR